MYQANSAELQLQQTESNITIVFDNYLDYQPFLNETEKRIKMAIIEILFNLTEKKYLHLLIHKYSNEYFKDKDVIKILRKEIAYVDSYGPNIRMYLLLNLIKLVDINCRYYRSKNDDISKALLYKVVCIYGKIFFKELNISQVQEKYLVDKK